MRPVRRERLSARRSLLDRLSSDGPHGAASRFGAAGRVARGAQPQAGRHGPALPRTLGTSEPIDDTRLVYSAPSPPKRCTCASPSPQPHHAPAGLCRTARRAGGATARNITGSQAGVAYDPEVVFAIDMRAPMRRLRPTRCRCIRMVEPTTRRTARNRRRSPRAGCAARPSRTPRAVDAGDLGVEGYRPEKALGRVVDLPGRRDLAHRHAAGQPSPHRKRRAWSGTSTLCLRSRLKREGRIGAEEVVPLVGIELTTYRLQGGCSTN